jgi:hypothetical protein
MAVFDHSLELLRFQQGPLKAHAKHALRGALLALGPRLASRVFTYHCGALASCGPAR